MGNDSGDGISIGIAIETLMGRISRKISKPTLLWPAMSMLLLAAMVAEANTRVKPADADPHQLRCKAAIEAFPLQIVGSNGIWTGTDVPQPTAATQLLHPNVILSRRYRQSGGQFAGVPVDLLIVDCKDARDLQGHYPPNCYPAQGYILISKQSRSWQLKDVSISGMAYHFAPPQNQLLSEKTVYNFFVTPHVPGTMVSHPELDGAICPDITSVYTSGEDYQRRYFGAAEFQIVTEASMSPEQLDQALTDLLEQNVNVIETLMNRDRGGK
jgi:hypothetical protein